MPPARSIERGALICTAVSPFLFFFFMVEGDFVSLEDYLHLLVGRSEEWSRFLQMLEKGSTLFTLVRGLVAAHPHPPAHVQTPSHT